jgi:hypothetical protein
MKERNMSTKNGCRPTVHQTIYPSNYKDSKAHEKSRKKQGVLRLAYGRYCNPVESEEKTFQQARFLYLHEKQRS